MRGAVLARSGLNREAQETGTRERLATRRSDLSTSPWRERFVGGETYLCCDPEDNMTRSLV